uniref:CSON013112 protein n=1 Tax=Culicoides sonorensis TaxID=179676 RepID=A0A336M7B4_CULSO
MSIDFGRFCFHNIKSAKAPPKFFKYPIIYLTHHPGNIFTYFLVHPIFYSRMYRICNHTYLNKQTN